MTETQPIGVLDKRAFDPVFTVVIPAYNRADTIHLAVDSVLRQSFQKFEILVIDDGSSDDLRGRVALYEDPRIRYVRQENFGANTARNNGIDRAVGKYVAFLDSDDQFLPHHLATLFVNLESNPGAAIFARIVVDRGDGATFLKPPRGPKPDERIDEYIICRQGFVQTSTIGIATDIARKVRYLDGLKAGQDIDFAIRLNAAGVRFKMIEEPGAIWNDRADPNRISAGSRPEMRLTWLNNTKNIMSDRAYYGYIGWFAAKSYAQQGNKAQALRMYFRAMTHRPYSMKLSARILLQILLVGGAYRRLSDFVIKRNSRSA